MEVTFKYAEHSDLEKIVATYNSTISSRSVTADLEEVSVTSREDWFASHSANKRPLWIVQVDGTYAGWMSFNSFYGRPAYDGTVEVSIYFDSQFRRKGLGKLCLEKAIQEAPHLQIHTLLGFIFGHNEISLELFYKYGFEKWGHLPEIANMAGEWRDLLILGKKV